MGDERGAALKGTGASAGRTANGAPSRGAVAVSTVSLATKRAPLQLSVRPVLACLDTPPAAGRAWVPDRRARTFHQSVGPLYDESTPCGRPGRDRFVISISSHVYMPLTGTRRAGPPCPSRPHRRLPTPPATAVAGGSENIRSARTIRRNVCSRSTHICCNSVAQVLGGPLKAIQSRKSG
jgi:hypothetical protein